MLRRLLLCIILCLAQTHDAHRSSEAYDDTILRTANDLYMQARALEDSAQMLTAMRTLRAVSRLLPKDARVNARVKKKLRQIHAQARGTVDVTHEGTTYVMSVWVPRNPVSPHEPGSADDMVATFFKWKRIPIFRKDSTTCMMMNLTSATIMGPSCLSGLYIATHNAVQAFIRGEEVTEVESGIPTSSRVSCGKQCGCSVPHRSLPLSPSAVTSTREILWRGRSPAGEDLTIYRGESRAEAMRRLVQVAAVAPESQLEAAAAMRRGIIDMLLARRPGMLKSFRPYVHRTQVFGDTLPQLSHKTAVPCSANALGHATLLQDVSLHPHVPITPHSSSSSTRKVASQTSRARTRRKVWHIAQNLVSTSYKGSADTARTTAVGEEAARTTEEAAAAGESEEGDSEAGAAEAEEAAAEFIWEHQHPADCHAQRAVVYHNDRAYWGFAANVHFMTAALNYALANRRVFIAQESDHWNYGGRDCRHGWQCYFHSPSNCSEREVWEPYSVPVRLDTRWDHRGYLYRIDTSQARVVSYANVDGPWQEVIGGGGGGLREWIPEQFRQRGMLWWRAQLTRYLLRPKAWVLGYIAARRHALSLPSAPAAYLSGGGVVGLHVRRGDKAYDQYQGSVFGSIDAYIEKARFLDPELATVYVSTDDPSVVESLPWTAKRHNLTLIYDSLEPRFNGTHIYAPPGISVARWPAFPGNDPNVNTTLYALETIKSIWLLSFSCHHFVGTVTSSMSRLVYQLRVAFGHPELKDEWTLDQDARHPPGWFADP